MKEQKAIQVVPPSKILSSKDLILASEVFESDPTVKDSINSIDGMTTETVDLEINSIEEKTKAADLKKDIRDARKTINEYRKGITDQFNNKIVNPLIDQARVYTHRLDEAEDLLESKIKTFILKQKEDQRIAEEKARKQREEGERKRREAQEKIDIANRKAAEAKTKKQQEEAKKAAIEAEKAIKQAEPKEPVNIPVAETTTKSEKSTMSEKTVYKYEIMDKRAVIKYAIDEELWDLIAVDEKQLKLLVKAYKDNKQIPGCRIYADIDLSSR